MPSTEEMPIKLNLIAACCEGRGIGFENRLPWNLKKEMAYFKTMTTETVDKGKKNAVIMGRKTWESIPAKYRPLEGRLNIILSKSMKILCSQRTKGCAILCDSLQEGLSKLADNSRSIESVWVIGGSSLYEECIVSPLCHRVYLTEIKKKFECDVFFPDIPENFHLVKDSRVPEGVQEEDGIEYEYKVYERKE